MIVITGVSGGLGRFLAAELGVENEIAGTYFRNRPAEEIPGTELYQVDVTDPKSVSAFATGLAPRLKRVVLINLAGISLNGVTHKLEPESWDQVIDTNLKGAFLMSRALLPAMRNERWGRVINVSSVVGQTGVPGTIAYSSSKAGLFGMTRTVAAENASRGVTANVLALGYFSVGLIETIPPEQRDVIRENIPMKRFGDPAELVRAVRFLIDCDYMTGTTMNINGGLL
jgi:NAD(P)-dependent dehydrogenase (short-subunit alcohol dehydrogenase family)